MLIFGFFNLTPLDHHSLVYCIHAHHNRFSKQNKLFNLPVCVKIKLRRMLIVKTRLFCSTV